MASFSCHFAFHQKVPHETCLIKFQHSPIHVFTSERRLLIRRVPWRHEAVQGSLLGALFLSTANYVMYSHPGYS